MKTDASSSTANASSRVLYSFWLSSCSWRVRFALNLKGLAYEYKSVNLFKEEQFNPGVQYCQQQYAATSHERSAGICLESMAKMFCQEESLAWAQMIIGKGFSALDKLLKNSDGKYAAGDEVSMADVFLAPQISIAMNRFNIDMSKYPTLRKVYESCETMPEFQATKPERQPDAIQH